LLWLPPSSRTAVWEEVCHAVAAARTDSVTILIELIEVKVLFPIIEVFIETE